MTKTKNSLPQRKPVEQLIANTSPRDMWFVCKLSIIGITKTPKLLNVPITKKEIVKAAPTIEHLRRLTMIILLKCILLLQSGKENTKRNFSKLINCLSKNTLDTYSTLIFINAREGVFIFIHTSLCDFPVCDWLTAGLKFPLKYG